MWQVFTGYKLQLLHLSWSSGFFPSMWKMRLGEGECELDSHSLSSSWTSGKKIDSGFTLVEWQTVGVETGTAALQTNTYLADLDSTSCLTAAYEARF